MTNPKKDFLFYLFLGIFNFIVFAIDIEYDRDIWTWLWLLCSIINFMNSFIYLIRNEIENLKN